MKATETKKNGASKLFANDTLDIIARVLIVAFLLFLFLVGVKTLTSSIKMMGSGFAKTLFDVGANPLISLFAGMLATALIQSSSATTSIIVGLVSSGSLSIAGAIPMIMGANLGTSVTNTLVSLAYMKNGQNFKRAFAAATVHDFFNILSVAVILPIELMTGILGKAATSLAATLYGSAAGFKFSSPVKAAIKPLAKGLKGFVTETLALDGTVAAMTLGLIGAAVIVAALSTIVKTMKAIVESNKGDIVEKLLTKNPYLAIIFGAAVTISVQSSSITTSLLVPMAGAGLLTLNSVLPVTIGANIGTTATALIAALAGNQAGLAIALVHFFFNIAGTLVWFPSMTMRQAPIKLSEGLANLATRNKVFGVGYIGMTFFGLPLLLVMLK